MGAFLWCVCVQMLDEVLTLMSAAALAESSRAFTDQDYVLTRTCARRDPFLCVRHTLSELLALAPAPAPAAAAAADGGAAAEPSSTAGPSAANGAGEAGAGKAGATGQGERAGQPPPPP